MTQNRTRLEKSEERFQILVKETKDYAIMMLNKKGTIMSWNKGGENLFGYTEQEILGKNFSILFTPEDRKGGRPQCELKTALQTGRALDENWAMKKDNSRFWASGITTALYDEQVMQNRVAKEGNDKAVALLAKMDAQINKLTTLISDLLDVTKIEGGKLQFHEESFAFDELVAEVVEEIQRTTERHTIRQEGKTGKTIFGDKNRIGQVMTNLLTNAIKYSPEATTVIVRATAEDRKRITLSVQDFGIGIPKDKQKHIFKRFYRVEGKRSQTYAGLGLGLYVASEIVKRQGGNMWVESEEGKGSTFSFSLPIRGSKGTRKQENTFIEEELKHE